MSNGGKQSSLESFFKGKLKAKSTPLFEPVVKDVQSNSPSSRKRKRLSNDDQYIIDAGQKRIGGQYCDKCDMTYNVDNENDVYLHERNHSGEAAFNQLIVNKRTLEDWVRKTGSSSQYSITGPLTLVLEVTQDCRIESLVAKVQHVVDNEVNTSLGYTGDPSSIWDCHLSSTFMPSTVSSSSLPSTVIRPRRKAYVAVIRKDDGVTFIGGITLVEAIERAFNVDANKYIRADRLLGVNRIWVEKNTRGKGIAKVMLDTARQRFFSVPIPSSRVAFSEPTRDGEKLARSYAKDELRNGRLLVYHLGNGETCSTRMKIIMKRRCSDSSSNSSQKDTVEDEKIDTVNEKKDTVDDEKKDIVKDDNKGTVEDGKKDTVEKEEWDAADNAKEIKNIFGDKEYNSVENDSPDSPPSETL